MQRRDSNGGGPQRPRLSWFAWILQWGGAALAALTLMFAIELGLRAVGFAHPELRPPLLIFDGAVDAQFYRDDGLHRVDLDTIWSLRPGAPLEAGGPEVVNELGMRGPVPSDPDRLRLASLGSSTSFGFGVDWHETFPARVAEAMGERGLPSDPILSGVIGHTLFQVLHRYRRDVAPLEPDVALLAVNGLNEHFPSPSGGDERHRRLVRGEFSTYATWRRALRAELRVIHAIDWLDERRKGGREAMVARWKAAQQLDQAAMDRRGQLEFEGQRRVSPGGFHDLLTQVVGELRSNGTAVVVVIMPRRASMDARLPILAEYDRVIRERIEYLRIEHFDGPEFFARLPDSDDELFIDEVHLTPLGHARLAEAVTPTVRAALARGV